MVTLLALLCLLFIALGPAGAYFEILSPMLGVYLAAGSCLILSFLFLLNFLVMVFVRKPRVNWFAFFFGMLAFGGSAYVGYVYYKNPIPDISTDLIKPPTFRHPAFPFRVKRGGEYLEASLQLNRDYDIALASKQELIYPDIRGVAVKASQELVFAEAMKAIREQFPGWVQMMADEKSFHSEFEVVSPLFHSVDDLVIEVRPDKVYALDSTVEIRSRSRVPLSDLGGNAFRVRDLRTRLTISLQPLEEKIGKERAEAEKKKEHDATATATGTGTGTASSTVTGIAASINTSTAAGTGSKTNPGTSTSLATSTSSTASPSPAAPPPAPKTTPSSKAPGAKK